MTIRIYIKIRSSLQLKEAKRGPKGAEKLMRRDLDKDPRDILKRYPQDIIVDHFATATGYIPLQILQNQYNPYLGAGAQGSVYEVTKNGKVYALKLADKNAYETTQEYDNRIKLRSLYRGFPTHIKKHFPLVYGMGEWAYAGEAYYYYIMEKLNPMDAANAHYFKLLDRSDGLDAPKKDASKLKVFADEDFKILNDIVYEKLLYGDDDVSGILDYFSNIENQEDENKLLDGELGSFVNKYLNIYYLLWQKYITKEAIKNLDASELKSYILMLNNELQKNSEAAVKRLADAIFIKERIHNFYESAANVKEFLDDHLKSINNNILNSILDPMIGDRIRPDDPELTFPEGPVKELYSVLKVLAKTYNIDVLDIKQSNVMQRKDGTLVVTDIGIWKFGDDDGDDS